MKTLNNPIVQPDLDKVEVAVRRVDPYSKYMDIVLHYGYMDGSDFVIKRSDEHHFEGDDFDAVFAVAPVGATVLEAVSDKLWALLVSKGIVSIQ